MVRRLIAILPAAAAAVPGTVIGVGTTIVMLLAIGSSHPMWRVEPINMSEAAVLRDSGTIVQLILRGEDPYARREIRADLLFNDRVELTPFEAGIAARRADIVDVILFSARTRPDAATWTHLKCLAILEGDKDVSATLDRYRPESATEMCDGVTRPWK
ncbi:MAG TPA: hypothetical protein VGF24_07980 [Vicinamibacterales bacterium]|jgi:hypothetical protein